MRTAHSALPQGAARLAAAIIAFAAWMAASPEAMAQAGEPVFPPALKVGLAPPPDFVLAPELPGFRHTAMQAEIRLGELPGSAYAAIEKQIEEEVARSPRTTVRHDITLKSGFPALLVQTVRSSSRGPVLQWTLVATAHDVTALVTALIPEMIEDVAPEDRLKASFATLAIRPAVPVEEQLSVLPFAMRELAGYRIVRVQPGTAAMLTDGPKDSVDYAEQPLLLVSIAPAPSMPRPEQRDGFARRLIGDTPGLREMRVVRSEPLRVAGQQGHELIVEAKGAPDGSEVSVVQWLRFGSGTILRLVGIARKDAWDEHYHRFRAVRDGIGPR